jgi:ubiquinone/menaquinone biosynthesis C-methylase UbiE
MPYEDNQFNTVLLISILERLKAHELEQAFNEIKRVLKPGGQVVYGAPVERPFMVFMFRILGYYIRDHHFFTEKDISQTAGRFFNKVSVQAMKAFPCFLATYEVGHLKVRVSLQVRVFKRAKQSPPVMKETASSG